MDNTDDFDIVSKPNFKSKKLLLSSVSFSSPKIHIVDADGDIIESLNIMSHAEKLRDAINQDPESIAHHYQVMIRDER
jgi:hypothetical protein